MKKNLALLLCALLLLTMTGCHKKALITVTASAVENTEGTEPAPTPTPIPETAPLPATGDPATVMVDRALVIWTLLNKGDSYEIVSEDEDYYTILHSDGVELMVEKRFIRPVTDTTWQDYTSTMAVDTMVYTAPYPKIEVPTIEISCEQQVTVLAELGDVARIRWNNGTQDMEGYVYLDELNLQGSEGTATQKRSNHTSDGQDGGDIDLSGLAVQNGRPSCGTGGIVLADQVEAYLGIVEINDKVLVTSMDEVGFYAHILMNEHDCLMWKCLLHMDNQEPYQAWDGFAGQDAKLYDHYLLTREEAAVPLELNTAVHVIFMNELVLVAEVNGTVGYMNPEDISDTEIVVTTQSATKKDNKTDTTSTDEDEDSWTDPVL